MKTPGPRSFFNAHHSPIGAFATMTLGCQGAHGGIASELKGPANAAIYLGVEDAAQAGHYHALPFFTPPDGEVGGSGGDYDVEGLSEFQYAQAVFTFADSAIDRKLGASIDTWTAGDLTVRIYSPVREVPDPDEAAPDALRLALVPAQIVELEVDNTAGSNARKAFFGYAGSDSDHAMHMWSSDGLTAVGQGHQTAIGTLEDAYAGIAWQPEAVLHPRHEENLGFNLGTNGLLVVTVPAGEKRTFRFAVAFYSEGSATTGVASRYLYQELFSSIEEVLRYALENASEIIAPCQRLDDEIARRLSPDRALMLGHAIRSYFGSSQLLRGDDGKPIWVINEGEYRMMNTLDLTMDQVFFELALNPWTVRNELDLFADRYSYVDQVRFHGEDTLYTGGLTFTHDMGVANHFTPPGRSCYEQAGLNGCFSYMSCEELTNWILCACLYVSTTGDRQWLGQRADTLFDAVESLINRDHADPEQRDGIMSLDSSRCQGGKEITTYDSLDASLGQARNNLYLGVKSWASYVLAEPLLREIGATHLADSAKDQAARAAKTVAASADENGLLPAVIGEGVSARIIPAIEALAYPAVLGTDSAVHPDGPYGALRKAVETHFDRVLTPGVCKFADGGWKLSSTSRNSWLSKIYLCQFVAERVLGKPIDAEADKAHLDWLMDEDNRYFAWSDQIVAGKAQGSRYYPRGVTAALWLADEDVISSLRKVLVGGA